MIDTIYLYIIHMEMLQTSSRQLGRNLFTENLLFMPTSSMTMIVMLFIFFPDTLEFSSMCIEESSSAFFFYGVTCRSTKCDNGINLVQVATATIISQMTFDSIAIRPKTDERFYLQIIADLCRYPLS